ncbi:hypothetical protein [Paenibacillus sp. IHBB 10380]|uniref:hypothetical protein n=1 Tax=Paenibacillus sp. IHBB 10380 TaxID=1566358 RepID=UPI002D21BF7D|nr:hypothetical protein [Paenibacillus sp. IHBB 10380]
MDGRAFDGFVESVDDEQLYLAIPVGHEMPHNEQIGSENAGHPECSVGHHGNFGGYPGIQTRALAQGFYPYPGVGLGFGYPGYPGYPPYGIRRFNRLILPLTALTALSLLPYY